MIILSVLDAKASRKPEGHPKRAKIFKSMAEKAIAFERILRACRTLRLLTWHRITTDQQRMH
jgi:hypothetical protein